MTSDREGPEHHGSTGDPEDSGSLGPVESPGAPSTPKDPAIPDAPQTSDSPVDPGTGPRSAEGTGLHPATGVPTGTAPRAVLRPVPEGFPTPPPRPARPNRRPALPAPEPAPGPRRSRILLAAAGAAALVLILGITGGVLAVRALTDDPDQADAPPAATSTDAGQTTATPTDEESDPPQGSPGSGASTHLGAITVRVVSTEVGLESVGDPSSPMTPRGQFVTVVLEITNESDEVLALGERGQVQLEGSDRGLHHPDPDASAAYEAPTSAETEVPAGGTGMIHAVFDIPVDTEPTTLHINLSRYGGAGVIPWNG